MAEISRFFGIIIYMYGYDHNPPHFHFVYGEYEGIMYIHNGVVEEEISFKSHQTCRKMVKFTPG